MRGALFQASARGKSPLFAASSAGCRNRNRRRDARTQSGEAAAEGVTRLNRCMVKWLKVSPRPANDVEDCRAESDERQLTDFRAAMVEIRNSLAKMVSLQLEQKITQDAKIRPVPKFFAFFAVLLLIKHRAPDTCIRTSAQLIKSAFFVCPELIRIVRSLRRSFFSASFASPR